jgi:hypothetical protein
MFDLIALIVITGLVIGLLSAGASAAMNAFLRLTLHR